MHTSVHWAIQNYIQRRLYQCALPSVPSVVSRFFSLNFLDFFWIDLYPPLILQFSSTGVAAVHALTYIFTHHI